jgi:hypothetical protein
MRCVTIKNTEAIKSIDLINDNGIYYIDFLNRKIFSKINKVSVDSNINLVKTVNNNLLIEERNQIINKTKIFTNDTPKYYCIFGCFRAHTSAFWGARTEFYIIAEDDKTGMLSWLIVDYDSNTISYDNKNGLKAPNSTNSVITINHRGKLFVDIKRDDNSRHIEFNIDTEKGAMQNLNQRLWLEGNLSIGYGSNFSKESADIFSLRFEPCEVEKALQIPLDSINITHNDWFSGLINEKPAVVACFPYAQHFISDSPGHSSNLKNKKELIESINKFDFTNINALSVKSFKRSLLINALISFVITATLVILYIYK